MVIVYQFCNSFGHNLKHSLRMTPLVLWHLLESSHDDDNNTGYNEDGSSSSSSNSSSSYPQTLQSLSSRVTVFFLTSKRNEHACRGAPFKGKSDYIGTDMINSLYLSKSVKTDSQAVSIGIAVLASWFSSVHRLSAAYDRENAVYKYVPPEPRRMFRFCFFFISRHRPAACQWRLRVC